MSRKLFWSLAAATAVFQGTLALVLSVQASRLHWVITVPPAPSGAVAGRTPGSPARPAPAAQVTVPAPAAPAAPTDVAPGLSARQLYADYEKDLAAADAKYLDRTVELSGVPCRVEKDEQGRYFIDAGVQRLVRDRSRERARFMSIEEYADAVQLAAANAEYLPGVVLFVRPEDVGRFAGAAGRPGAVRAVCRGAHTDPRTLPNFMVVLEGCVPAR
jgi:tRNA_anti-like